MTKNSFLMYTDWGDMIEELDEENRSQLLLAIMRYQSDKELPEMDLGARVAFAQIRTQFRKDEEKYSKKAGFLIICQVRCNKRHKRKKAPKNFLKFCCVLPVGLHLL